MRELSMKNALESILPKKQVKSSKGMGNTIFYSLDDIASAFDFDNDPVTVAITFSDIPKDLTGDLFDESFIQMCEYLQILKDKGGKFAYDLSDYTLSADWGIAVPGGES